MPYAECNLCGAIVPKGNMRSHIDSAPCKATQAALFGVKALPSKRRERPRLANLMNGFEHGLPHAKDLALTRKRNARTQDGAGERDDPHMNQAAWQAQLDADHAHVHEVMRCRLAQRRVEFAGGDHG